MDDLKKAIREAGGVTALAAALGISQSRVSNWLTRNSVPDGWLQVIRMRAPFLVATPTPTPAAQGAEQGASHA